jgi:hypothetical protein
MAQSDSRLDPGSVPADRIKIAIGTSLNGHIDIAQPNYESFLRGAQVSPWAALEFPAHAATRARRNSHRGYWPDDNVRHGMRGRFGCRWLGIATNRSRQCISGHSGRR